MNPYVRAGLEAYASDDPLQALEAWGRVPSDDPDYGYARAYIEFVRDREPGANLGVSSAGDIETPPPPGPGPDARVSSDTSDRADLGDAFSLVTQVEEKRRAPSIDTHRLYELEQRLAELIELDDLSGALDAAERLLTLRPEHAGAAEAANHCRETLLKMHVSKLGDVTSVPKVLCPPDRVIWLDLDHRSGFILSQVDGVSSYQDIMEIAGMDRLESAAILAQLVSAGVVGLPTDAP
ncbi:MAG: hypothetical protein AAF735_03155 [Myxococcota bacterium]